jgi:hypothetical protein
MGSPKPKVNPTVEPKAEQSDLDKQREARAFLSDHIIIMPLSPFKKGMEAHKEALIDKIVEHC